MARRHVAMIALGLLGSVWAAEVVAISLPELRRRGQAIAAASYDFRFRITSILVPPRSDGTFGHCEVEGVVQAVARSRQPLLRRGTSVHVALPCWGVGQKPMVGNRLGLKAAAIQIGAMAGSVANEDPGRSPRRFVTVQ